MIKKYSDLNVEQIAKSKGYNLGPVYHGTKVIFNVFSPQESLRGDNGLFQERVTSPAFFFTKSYNYANSVARNKFEKGVVLKCFISLQKPLDLTSPEGIYIADSLFNLFPENEDLNDAKDQLDFWENRYTNKEREDYRQEQIEFAKELIKEEIDKIDNIINIWQIFDIPENIDILRKNHYDGAIFQENGKETSYAVFDPSQIKLADSVTYDDNKNQIPLSERFNPNNPDIRY